MSKQEYYEYCFECECNGEIPLSYGDLAGSVDINALTSDVNIDFYVTETRKLVDKLLV